MHLDGAVGFSLVGFFLIGAAESSLARGVGVYLTGASTSCVERLISLGELIQKLIGDIANNEIIPGDDTMHHVVLIFVSVVYWIHSIC